MKTALVVPALPSLTVASAIDSDGKSSLRIVAVAVARAIVAPDAPLRPSVNVSSASIAVSAATGTLTAFDVCPAAKVSVPDAAV